MMFIDRLYNQSVADNEKNVRFWQDYLNSLRSLDLNVYAEKLKVPILVPIGSRMFFRGDLKHTNEITVSLGADYFVKCSVKDAEILRQHRIKDAQAKLDTFLKEKEYLESHLSFAKQNVYNKEGQEIIEHYSIDEDEAWRKIHRENVKKYKQKEAKEKLSKPKDDTQDTELWERLEELELQEELENEMLGNYNEIVDSRKENTFLVNEKNILLNSFKEEAKKLTESKKQEDHDDNNIIQPKEQINHTVNKTNTMENTDKIKDEPISSKLDVLQQVLERQNELENKLYEIKYRERDQSKTEEDLISKLDEMDQLEELEDEIDRLDDILDKNVESDESEESGSKLKKSISFADDDDSETLEITFTHSNTEPSNENYSPENGITKPSDIYQAYSNLFDNKPTSILKKSKYESTDPDKGKKSTKQIKFSEIEDNNNLKTDEPETTNRTIVINDVVEKSTENLKKIDMDARPTSLFKKKRLQNKAQFT